MSDTVSSFTKEEEGTMLSFPPGKKAMKLVEFIVLGFFLWHHNGS